MGYELIITIGRSGPAWKVKAEIESDLSSDSAPETIKGKLLGLPLDRIVMLKFAENKVVGLLDALYQFSSLEKDGSLELRKYANP